METKLTRSEAAQQPARWDHPCSESHLAVISGAIDDWRAISPFLELTEADEIAILESTHSVPARKMAMMRKWKQKHAAKATYKRLCRAFGRCKRADLVDVIEQLLAESESSSDEEFKGAVLNKEEQICVDFVTSLQQVYRTAQSPTWDPLPQCQYVKLAMIKEKGKRCGSDKTIAESRVEGDVDKLLTIKVPVDSDAIFDAGTFDDKRQVILVEGVGGMGKTSFAYQYAKKWAEGKLSTFDAVALVRLRDLNEYDVREVDRILPHLLFLATCSKIKPLSKEMAHFIVENQKILLILDGWDECPLSIRKPSFLENILLFASPQTRILITSRPNISLNLHGLVNRVEILGFTKGVIHSYFENAMKSQLPDSEVKSACDKLSRHFHRYPVIESCCYVPLNAAILAYIYLNRDQTLPITRCELFQELVLCCIVRELETHKPIEVLEDISSFVDLPPDLKKQLHKLSELAFNGVMQNKIVFTQKELTSLSTLGLLHSVQGFGSIGRKLVTGNFIHMAVQELLAAYYISHLQQAEHAEQLKTLLSENSNYSVLQFYAGLTGLTNESVQDLLTGFEFGNYTDSLFLQKCLLGFVNCMFEAQINDERFFERMIDALSGLIDLCCITLNPLDCQSVNYFFSSYIKTGSSTRIDLRLSDCDIDDQSLGLLLGTFHDQKSVAFCTLEPVKALQLARNNLTDTGIQYIASALNLVSNSNLEELKVGNEGVTDMGLVALLEALPRHRSLHRVRLFWTYTQCSKSLEKILECLKSGTIKQLELFTFSPALQSESEIVGWIFRLCGKITNLKYFLRDSEVRIWTNIKLQCNFSISSLISQFLHEFCNISHTFLICNNTSYRPKSPTHVHAHLSSLIHT